MDNVLAGSQCDQIETRNHLAAYGFTGDCVFKPVTALSGGGKAETLLSEAGSQF